MMMVFQGVSTLGTRAQHSWKESSSSEHKCAVLEYDAPSQDLLFKWSEFVCVVRVW